MVDQVDDVVAAATGALSDTGAGDGDGEMGLSGAVPPMLRLLSRKSPPESSWIRGSLTGEAAISKSASSLAVGSLADVIWYLMELLVGDLGLQQRTDDLLQRMTALEPVDGHYLSVSMRSTVNATHSAA